jgi:antitoxin (DNA-binding transcriptional repressor) of toxin-antitoxin stability system
MEPGWRSWQGIERQVAADTPKQISPNKNWGGHVQTINICDAKKYLSRLVEQAAKGETFIIAKGGKPMVKVVPLSQAATPTRLGFLSGQFPTPRNFDTLGQAEIEKQFLPLL